MIRVTIKEAAQRRGIDNPKQLADKMNAAAAPVWKVWTGRVEPKLKMLDRICEALGCDLGELITREPGRKIAARPEGTKKKKPKPKAKKD